MTDQDGLKISIYNSPKKNTGQQLNSSIQHVQLITSSLTN